MNQNVRAVAFENESLPLQGTQKGRSLTQKGEGSFKDIQKKYSLIKRGVRFTQSQELSLHGISCQGESSQLQIHCSEKDQLKSSLQQGSIYTLLGSELSGWGQTQDKFRLRAWSKIVKFKGSESPIFIRFLASPCCCPAFGKPRYLPDFCQEGWICHTVQGFQYMRKFVAVIAKSRVWDRTLCHMQE